MSDANFVSNEVLDARYFKALDRFDIRFAPTMWVYDNVRAGSEVLHLGCGAGMLALLKRKGITLTGVDVSHEFALAARRNGYDATFATELSRLPFADASFDYVISLESLGNGGNEKGDAVLAEMKRVLRPGGLTLHGIECDSASGGEEHSHRFQKFFQHVAWEPRHALCLSSEDFLEQTDKYDLKVEADFLDYLHNLSFKERRAFDIAMGYVFGKVSDLNIRLPKSGLYLFLKASDAPLGPFYNEYRDRSALFSCAEAEIGKALCLDRNIDARFDDGWYEPTMLPPVARWMGKRGRVRFHASGLSAMSLDLTTNVPDLRMKPLGLELLLNGVRLCAFSLYNYGWLELPVRVPETLSSEANGEFELELRANRTSQPCQASEGSRDDRELSVAVCNIAVHQ